MSELTRRFLLQGGAALAATGTVMLSVPRAQAAKALDQFKPAGNGTLDHAALDALLRAYVKPDSQRYNRVDYRALKARQGDLKRYISTLEATNPVTLGRDEAHAYWMNLYNAKTLDVILEHYPVQSIKNIRLGGGGLFGSGPWSADLMKVNGTDLSLDDVEHRIVRALFNDPMSHYGLNCASYSCPNLMTNAYTGSAVNAMLVENARHYVNHPRGVSIERNRITASKIYSWYDDDFGGRKNLKDHWKQFAEAGLVAQIDEARIGSFTYDWALNDV